MCMPCVRLLLTPRGETSGLMGAVPRTGQDGRRSSAQVLSEREAGGEGGDLSTVSGPRGRGARRLTEHAAHPGAATREPTRSPRGRQCEYPSQGDHPQNWRATSKGPAGGRYIFNTVGVLALLWSLAFVYLFGELLVCVFIASYVFHYSLVWRSSLLFFVLPGSSLRASACLRQFLPFYDIRHPGRTNCVLEIGCGEASCVSVSYL